MDQEEIVENYRIKPLVEQGIAQVIEAKFCEEFDDYLCTEYPWIQFTDRIDWKKVEKPYKRLNWENANSKETIEFLKKTCLNNFNEVCIVYGANERGIIVKFEYLCKNIENLVIFGWASRAIVGVKRNSYGLAELVHECFVEVDFSDWLTASY